MVSINRFVVKQNKMRFTITLFFSISVFLSFGQTRAELDSLNQVSESLVCVDRVAYDALAEYIFSTARLKNFQSQEGTALLVKAYGEKCKGNHKEAVKILQQSIIYFNEENNKKGVFKAYTQIANAKMRMSEIDSAFYYADISHQLSLTLNDTLLLTTSYLTKSFLHRAISNSDSIIFYALKGLDVLGTLKDDDLRGSLNIEIGGTYYQNEDFPRAIKYYTKAKEYFTEESLNMGRIYHNMALAFTSMEEFDSAFICLFKTIPMNKKLDRKMFLAYNYNGLAHLYSKTGNCNKSIEYNLLSLKMSDEISEIRSKSTVLANISECYIQVGQIDKAVESVKMSLLLTQETGDQDKEADAYFLLSEAYEAQGKFKEAYEAHKKFYSLDSMLLGRDRQATVASLEAEYDSEKKEAEIASLSQQSAIQSLEIEQKNQAISTGVIVFLFILVIVFFIVKQRSAKRQQAQTEIEQRFLRSQLNPHFIFNALLAIQNFMLKNDAQKAAQYLAKFSLLMREILENSRQEFIPVSSEIEMISSYMDIHKLRLNDSFDYEIKVDEGIDPDSDTIPPMFIQPFVENAIEHGIAGLEKSGVITLHFSKIGDHIEVVLTDNGKGLERSADSSKSHESLSSTIIQERMDLFNKSLKRKIKLMLSNLKNESGEITGTRVELRVPFG